MNNIINNMDLPGTKNNLFSIDITVVFCSSNYDHLGIIQIYIAHDMLNNHGFCSCRKGILHKAGVVSHLFLCNKWLTGVGRQHQAVLGRYWKCSLLRHVLATLQGWLMWLTMSWTMSVKDSFCCLLSFQKVCRIRKFFFFGLLSKRDVT